MKTIETQKEATRLLNVAKKELEELIEELEYSETIPAQHLVEEIKLFLSKDDLKLDIENDCKKYLRENGYDFLKSETSIFENGLNPNVHNYHLIMSKNYTDNEDSECPMNNLKDRMRKTYPEIFKTLDFSYKQERNVARTIYEEFFYAFQKLGLDIIIDYSKDNYNPYVLFNNTPYIVSGNYEFDETVRMACVEKCFDLLNYINNTSIKK